VVTVEVESEADVTVVVFEVVAVMVGVRGRRCLLA
jgi:hypothetical protein